ncbi:Sporulation and spore germination [Nonomuraea coxensis DSM 45129]|uniref:Sporulation and spore germination n=1 Tax=Nonomuraea coxensis DSM 45129 TaxID=1122611 RepID=A0ABX8U2G2_9ACTN|nr:GerMN domain-containing protein [Nonomuraea coxensis]QYC41854.1 Sporulation and spore germination [Nonomuraea coxensis DSM 45129]
MLPIRPLITGAALAAAVTVPLALPAQASPLAPVPPTLTGVRAAHHPGFDRLVFEFRGRLPRTVQTRYVSRIVDPATGRTVGVVGDALLRVRFDEASTAAAPARTTYPLPGVIQVAAATPYDSELTYGVGLARQSPYRVYKLIRPSRVVVDITTPYRTVPVRDYFLNTANYDAGRQPYTAAVQRPVVTPATAYGALQRLFAGPTQDEKAQGLRFVTSKATGFSKLTVKKGVARVYLTGRLNGAGSTFTIADEIMPTLKQFPSIKWVKIYDARGHTQQPYGPSDSVPRSLEP